jgi:sugar transferase (PEP-CTERM/EpsH1 system associated)
MNILFVCHRLPFPPTRGGKIRPFHIIKHLNESHSVTVVSLAESVQELEEGLGLKKYCKNLIAEKLSPQVRWIQAYLSLLGGTPSSVAYFRSSRLMRRVKEVLEREHFDLVFVHCAFVAQYVLDIQGSTRIIDFGDLDSEKWFGYSLHKPFPLSLGFKIEARKLRNYEKMIASQFNHCTVTTRGELDSFQKLNVPTPCNVIPNGVDLNYFHNNSKSPQVSNNIVFVGRMDYYPNIDGAEYFVNDILPIIRQQRPNVTFQIVGSNPGRRVYRLASTPGVSVTGHVSDVRPYLTEAEVAVAPLRIARGVQNKVLEALAMKIPSVTTPQVARGLEAIEGEHLLVGNGPAMFAKQVLRLLEDSALRTRISEAGRRFLEEHHTWTASMKILDKVKNAYCPG